MVNYGKENGIAIVLLKEDNSLLAWQHERVSKINAHRLDAVSELLQSGKSFEI